MQQRALSRARLADNRNEFAAADFDVDSAQHGNFVLTLAVRLLDGDGGNVRLRHSDDLGHETSSTEYTFTAESLASRAGTGRRVKKSKWSKSPPSSTLNCLFPSAGTPALTLQPRLTHAAG